MVVSAIAAVFLMLYYVSGILCGFYNALYKLSFDSLWRYILPIASIIIASEVIRYVALSVDSKAIYVLTYVTCVLSDLALQNGFVYFDNVNGFMEFVGLTLFPALTTNILLNYTAKSYGFFPGMAYRGILALYPYFIPIIPSTPEILPSFVMLVTPILIRNFIKGLFGKRRPSAKQKKNKWAPLVTAFVTVWVIMFVMLISCQFRYGIIVIGTGSMTGEINRGDAVVYESYEDHDVQEEDIIVFKKDEYTRIVHRVVAIESVRGETRYITKGDANAQVDFGYVTEDQIVGIVKFKVLYIGYPSLWLKDIFSD